MIFHADSESDLKTTPNQIKNQILSKIRFLWYFDLKFPLRYGEGDLQKYLAIPGNIYRRRKPAGVSAPPNPPDREPQGGQRKKLTAASD